MNLSGNAYALLDYGVPFYQIAIHGLKDYTGEAINLAGDTQTLLLESAEYGAGLNFTFMAEDGKLLQDTLYTGYFGASFNEWGEKAKELIAEYQTSMAGLNAQEIVGHEALTADVSVTTYANGVKVYVNYGTDDWEADGVAVPSRSYFVKGEN
jgi:hypothetical protein